MTRRIITQAGRMITKGQILRNDDVGDENNDEDSEEFEEKRKRT